MRLVIIADYPTPAGLDSKAVGLLKDPSPGFVKDWMDAHLREAMGGYPGIRTPLSYRTFQFPDDSTFAESLSAMIYPVNRDAFPPEVVS